MIYKNETERKFYEYLVEKYGVQLGSRIKSFASNIGRISLLIDRNDVSSTSVDLSSMDTVFPYDASVTNNLYVKITFGILLYDGNNDTDMKVAAWK